MTTPSSTPEFELPTNLVEAVARYAPPGGPQRAWFAALPTTIAALADHWSLELGRPYQPGGDTAWVAPVRTAPGGRAVLKVGWRHDEALHQAEGLRTWAGEGAVRLLDERAAGETDALLLEVCEPGTTLSAALPADEQDVVLAGLLRRLWIVPPAGHPFRRLADMCAWWAEEFEQKYAAAPREHQIDSGLARAGAALFRDLPKDGAREALLCTDLHPGNVLAAEREPWLVIDPKPYVGDPTYDALQHMLNFPARLVADPGGFAARMAGLLDLDVERLRNWLFARAVQESVTMPWLHPVVHALAPR